MYFTIYIFDMVKLETCFWEPYRYCIWIKSPSCMQTNYH